MSEQVQTTVQLQMPEADSELLTVVDELGALHVKVAEAKKVINAYNKVRAKFLELACAAVNDEDGTTVVGNHFTVVASPCQNKREVADKAAIFEALGNDTFIELAQFALGDLDRYLTPSQLAKSVKESFTGPRKVTVSEVDDS
jgi:hypothetical protein